VTISFFPFDGLGDLVPGVCCPPELRVGADGRPELLFLRNLAGHDGPDPSALGRPPIRALRAVLHAEQVFASPGERSRPSGH